MAFLRRLPRCCAAKQLQQVVRERTSTAAATAATSAPAQAEVPPAQTSRQLDPLDLKFNDPVASFKSKTMIELVRAYVVYQLCSVELLVENNARASITTELSNITSINFRKKYKYTIFFSIIYTRCCI